MKPPQVPDAQPRPKGPVTAPMEISAAIAQTAPPLRLLHQNLPRLLLDRDPDPQPANHLDKNKNEEDAVLQPIPAPPRRRVAGAGATDGRRSHPAAALVAVEGRRRAEQEGVAQQQQREEEAQRRLRAPVVDQAGFLGQGQRDEVGEAPEGEHDGEEGEGRGLGFEAALVRLWGEGGRWLAILRLRWRG